MRRRLMLLWVASALLASTAAADQAATWSFTAGEKGSCPNTVTAGLGKITVDLSAIPKGAKVFRAVLRCRRKGIRPHISPGDQGAVVVPAGEGAKPLPLLPPRYGSLDATAAVTAALKTGKLELTVKKLAGMQPETVRLDVSIAGAGARGKPGMVTGLTARHRNGQTILTWTEVDPPSKAEKLTIAELKDLRAKPGPVRYRIYRSPAPITAKTIVGAALIDEIGQLSCWNGDYYGVYPKGEAAALRYGVIDGQGPVAPGTAIYAHNPAKGGRAHYAVTVVRDGAEDLTSFDGGNSLVGLGAETVGPGDLILQRTVKPKSFVYVTNPTLYYYVRWEAPPRSNLPSRPFDYLVAVPPRPKWPAQCGIHFHCWGGSLNSGYGWWYNGKQGSVLISTNQIPYDWWTGYHEAKWTWKAWDTGVVRSYSIKRVRAFYEWVAANHKIDRKRVFAAGSSMGGSGCLMFAARNTDLIAWSNSWVGVHVPAKTPQFKGSYEQCYGLVKFGYKHEGGENAWDYFSDVWYLKKHPDVDMGFFSFANGKLDGGIGWPQAVEYVRALQETRQPHLFNWGMVGHGARSIPPGEGSSGSHTALALRSDRSIPAFTRCSLDQDPGTGKAKTKAQRKAWLAKRDAIIDPVMRKRLQWDPFDGDPAGAVNRYLVWSEDNVTDEPDKWEMTIWLMGASPKDECTVDITPRRCQKFRAKPGEKFHWTNAKASRFVGAVEGGQGTHSGTVTADKWGLVTLPKVTITKARSRIMIARVK